MPVITEYATPGAVVSSGALITPGGPPGPAAYTPTAPVVLGETTTPDSQFPSGIVVPRYGDHPDAAWAYGSYDDHFDAGTLNAKWTQAIGTGGVISLGRSHVLIWQPASAGTLTTGITQAVPAAQNFTISFKIRFSGATAWFSANNNVTSFYFTLYAGAQATSVRLKILMQVLYATTSAANNNQRILLDAGANQATSIADGLWAGDLPLYYRILYTHSSRVTYIMISFDGINWATPFTSITGAQSGFSTTSPANFQIMAQTVGANGFAYLDLDWFRITTP